MNVTDRRIPAPKQWPFYLADAFLLAFAVWLLNHYPHPLPAWAAILMSVCVVSAAFLALVPHRLEYQTSVKLAEADGLVDTVRAIQKLETLADHISGATGQWQGVQEHASRTIGSAREIADRITAEARSFAEFMQKANDTEKSTLRLEVEKLRRGEGQWLQVLVNLLDHVFALYQAGLRSEQPNLQAQLGQFQDACRDIVRRVGLSPFEAEANERFDAEKHQVPDGHAPTTPESRVAQTLATGYTFQGQLLRRSLVALHADETAGTTFAETGAAEPAADQLPAAETDGEFEAATAPVDEEAPSASYEEPGNSPATIDLDATSDLGLDPEFFVVGEGPSSAQPKAQQRESGLPPFRLESEVLPSDKKNHQP